MLEGQLETLPPDAPDPFASRPPVAQTLVFGGARSGETDPDLDPSGVSPLMYPGGPDMQATMQEGPIGSTLPSLPNIGTDPERLAPMRLEQVSSPDLGGVAPPVGAPAIDIFNDAAVEALARRSRRRSVIAIVAVLVVVLLAGAAVVWQFFGKQLLNPGIAAETRNAVEQAVGQLRKDDPETRKTETSRLEQIVKDLPAFADAHAALVLALSLDLDDLHAENSALVSNYAILEGRLNGMKDSAEKNALAARINGLVAQQTALRERDGALRAKVDKAQRAMETAAEALEPGSSSEAAVGRARAYVKAVSGLQTATAIAEKFQDPDDYWVRLVPASLALNSVGLKRADFQAALATLDGLKADDGTARLPRPYLLTARLLIELSEREKADAALNKALEFSGDYTPALELRRLLASVDK